mgnify:CR=1 FL=1
MEKHQRGGVLPKALVAILAGGAIAAFIAVETVRYREINRLRDTTNVLREDVMAANEKADAALSAVIAPQTLAAAQASVYLIVVDGSARGTAFVIDRENGILVTAAHTADSLPLSDEKHIVQIVNRFNKTPIRVAGKKLHAGFGTFRALVEEYQPIRKNSSIYAPQAAPLRDLAFDAGLLMVEPVDPASGENMLGPDLEIADEGYLLQLEAGAPIAVIGYPYDTLDDGFAPDAAIPRIERGVIAAITPPLDNFHENRDTRTANLIIHRLSTAGGNSGSPILDANGKVVGIHTHGIESTSSNADGAAQRAEVIYDLISTEREQHRLETIFYPSWRQLLSYWARAEDILPWSFFMEYAHPGQNPAPLVGSLDLAAKPPFSKTSERLLFEPETEARRVDASDVDQAKISASEGGTALLRDGSSFLIEEQGEYAEIWRTIDRSRDNLLYAFDYSLRSRRGFCPLKTFWRKKGDTRLRVLPQRASFELHLPEAGDFSEDYHIIFRRDASCDPISAEFLFGAIAWLSDNNDDIVTVSARSPETKTRATEVQAQSAFEGLRKSASRFFRCSLQTEKAHEICTETAYIELQN